VVLATSAGRRLAFSKLRAEDADGRALPARFEIASASRLRLVVDDASGRYPLVIDPLLTASPDTQLESDQASAFLGFSVDGAGDVNGDGFADVIVGMPGADQGFGTPEGMACIFHGSAVGVPDGNPSTAATRLDGDFSDTFLGRSVAGAGDVNGDGYADVIAGADFYGLPVTDAGAAFVFLGNGDGDGRPVLARQLRTTNDLPLQPWTRAESAARFRIAATHPEGRGRVKLQLEHCPPGRPFGTPLHCATITQASWTGILFGSVPVTLTSDVAGLPSNVVRRWRARVLYAPSTVAAPLVPAHGPWRRVQAQAFEADFRSAQPSGGGGGGCGIGPELALLLPLLFAVRVRRSRTR